MHYTQVRINRDEMTGLVVHVGAWEVPILEAKHGESKLEVGELKDFPRRDWPQDAASEMQRLNTLYGIKGSGDAAMSYAERVYGEGSMGVKRLQEAIDAAKLAAEPKAKRARKGADLVGAATG